MKKSARLILLGLAVVLLAAGLHLGFASTYLSDLIPGHAPNNCGSAFRPSSRCGPDIDTDHLRVPAIALLVASALCGCTALAARGRSASVD